MKPLKVSIPEGTTFSSCEQSLKGLWKECNVNKLSRPRDGFLTITTEVDSPGSFVSPDLFSCSPPQKDRSCDIQLTFSREQLDQLALTNIEIAEALTQLNTDNTTPEKSGQFPISTRQDQSANDQETTQVPKCYGPLDCSYSFVLGYWGYFALLGFLLIIFAFRQPLSRLIFADDSPKVRTKSSRSAKTSTTPPVVQQPSDSIVIQNQVFSLEQKFNQILRRLDQMDMRFLELEQRLAESASKSLSSRDSTPSSGVVKPQASIHPPQPPRVVPPLTVGLITDAVLNADYSLIAPYPHFFLDENSDSRQGRFERKRFDVQGDQRQASSYANSEFVAITLDSTTYLIPNLLPNAADPRRTMKRLTDSNSVYRGGSGSNILRITQLAVLQPLSSNSFELLSDGHVE